MVRWSLLNEGPGKHIFTVNGSILPMDPPVSTGPSGSRWNHPRPSAPLWLCPLSCHLAKRSCSKCRTLQVLSLLKCNSGSFLALEVQSKIISMAYQSLYDCLLPVPLSSGITHMLLFHYSLSDFLHPPTLHMLVLLLLYWVNYEPFFKIPATFILLSASLISLGSIPFSLAYTPEESASLCHEVVIWYFDELLECWGHVEMVGSGGRYFSYFSLNLFDTL